MPLELQPHPASSNVDATAYDPASQTLAVRFKSGAAVYHYKDVPPDVARDFAAAESAQKFLNLHVKPNYEFDKIAPEGDA